MKLARIVIASMLLTVSLVGIWQFIDHGTIATAQEGDDNEEVQEILDDITFRPVSDIVDQELIVTNFANDGSATLPIVTSVSVACTIVYGTTPAFGSLTLDQDMAGGTHTDHSPLLTGLEPETTYYFRVQGVDDDGIMYVSETMTFTTPPMDETATTNLASPALGATVTDYSSAFGGAAIDERWGASGAFDDNPNTEWSTDGDGDSAFIEVELAGRAQIDSVEFWSRAMSNGTSITLEFTVTTDDGETYGPFAVPDADEPYVFDVDIEAKTLRFELSSTTGGNTGVVNIAVYGDFIEPIEQD